MHLLKDTSRIAVGTAVLAAVLLLANIGRADLPLVATGAALTALLLTFMAITVNTFRNATPARPMGRLLHDPDGIGRMAPKMPPPR